LHWFRGVERSLDLTIVSLAITATAAGSIVWWEDGPAKRTVLLVVGEVNDLYWPNWLVLQVDFGVGVNRRRLLSHGSVCLFWFLEQDVDTSAGAAWSLLEPGLDELIYAVVGNFDLKRLAAALWSREPEHVLRLKRYQFWAEWAADEGELASWAWALLALDVQVVSALERGLLVGVSVRFVVVRWLGAWLVTAASWLLLRRGWAVRSLRSGGIVVVLGTRGGQ